jgi:iron complex transport system substrate-binding protein
MSALLLGLLLLPALHLVAENDPARTRTRTVIDQTGRTVHVPTDILRVITLAPNLTEIIYALGQQHRLVGVTTECDYPPEVSSKTRVGDVVNPNLERIIELKPDLVLGSTAGNRIETVRALEQAGVPLYGLDARVMEDIFTSIRNVADLLDVPEVGDLLARQLEERLASLDRTLRDSPRPTVLLVIWLEPLLTTGPDTFLADMLGRAGAESITADLQQKWPRLSLEAVIERDPDYLVLPRIPQLEERLARLVEQPPWSELRAVRRNRIVWLDEALIRPGPRIIEMTERLARTLHPRQTHWEAVDR